ncbi:MAG: hypothetical protein AAF251_16350 [Pseudomonadota bacterium]
MKLFASLAVIAVSGAPITVASAASPEGELTKVAQTENSPEAEVATWPAEKQDAYRSWPPETQAYYWTLSEERQKLFWGLADSDKVALSGMSAEDQEKAWARIEGRT